MITRKLLQTLRLGMLTFTLLGAAAGAGGCSTAPDVPDDPNSVNQERSGGEAPAVTVGKGRTKLQSWDTSWGESGGACSDPVEFEGTGTAYRTTETAAQNLACERAAEDAEQKCLNSAWLCTPHAGEPTCQPLGCRKTEGGNYWCDAEAEVECTYTYW